MSLKYTTKEYSHNTYQIKILKFDMILSTQLPVNPAASEAKKVLYDIKTKSVVSKSGKSRI